jgi:glyoxylase-like metal-dependent hydrolase (beta-lactamase superfamily II)
LIDRDTLTLIDPGLPRNSRKIETYVRDVLGREPSDITTIILTHYYMDHTGSAQELKVITGAKVAIHEADARYVAGKQIRPAPDGILVFQSTIGAFYKPRPVKPDILLKDGDEIAGLSCIHTPGHTPGSISLFDPASKVLFAGDTLRYNGLDISGPPPQFTFDIEEAKRSIWKITPLDFRVLLAGHGIPLTHNANENVREFARSFSGANNPEKHGPIPVAE